MKIISDGTTEGTLVIDELGNPIGCVESITWSADATEPLSKVVTLWNIPVELYIDEHRVIREKKDLPND